MPFIAYNLLIYSSIENKYKYQVLNIDSIEAYLYLEGFFPAVSQSFTILATVRRQPHGREKQWPRYFGRESRVCYLQPISAVLMVKVYMMQHRDCFIEFIGESLPRISSFLFFDVFRNVKGICRLYLVDPSLWISLELMLTTVDIRATK